MHDCKLAVGPNAAHGPIGQAAISERNFQNAGGSSKGSQRLCGTEDVDQSTPDHTSLERRRDAGGAVGISDKLVADAGNDHALAVGEEHLTPRRTRPRRNHLLQAAPPPGNGLVAPSVPHPVESAPAESRGGSDP